MVTAPANGAAGVIPAVLHYCGRFVLNNNGRAGHNQGDDAVIDFLMSAAAIGMEHNLGLTCDPIGGLVQVPCIERNAMGAVKAVNAARMALPGNGQYVVPLDNFIKTMRETGADMKTKYKETSRGGLAVNIVEC